MSPDESVALTRRVAQIFVKTAHGISIFFSKIYVNNESDEPLPPVLQRHILKIDMHKFMEVIQRHH